MNDSKSKIIFPVIQLSFILVYLMTMPVSGYALTPAEVFEKVKDTVVFVKSLDTRGNDKSQGSRALLSAGKAVTNDHVVEDGAELVAKKVSQADWKEGAIALEDKKNWQGMIDWCQKWTKSDFNNFNAWFCLGTAYANFNRHDDAVDAYHQAIRIDPEMPNAWYNLGYAYYRGNRYDDAIVAYLLALRINPEMASAWYNLGAAYAKINRYDDAIDAYLQAQRLDPELANKLFDRMDLPSSP
jgi:tetratricopeptide (TPR) repeat protein